MLNEVAGSITGNNFVAKNDAVNILSPFIKKGGVLLNTPPDLFQQAYLAYSHIQKIEPSSEEIAKIQNIYDYEKTLDMSKLDDLNNDIIKSSSNVTRLQKTKH
ncbi:MAG: hypothetical protein HYS43_01285, partial [Candidatus Liptonbacteria bacterium]|nr:hypothetical protein [Candidatus Liptonbacteria bacterium]